MTAPIERVPARAVDPATREDIVRNHLKILAAAAVVGLGLQSAPALAAEANLWGAIETRPELSSLAEAIETAGLKETLQGDEPLTLLAPDNVAFEQLPSELEEMLKKPDSKETLAALLRHHIVEAALPTKSFDGETEVETLDGSKLTVTSIGDQLMVGEARIRKADIAASNGLIDVIDKVLVPEGLIVPASGAE
ncbi:hypothetical protein CKO32_15615 [Afifella marina DSM 2698]|nr:fasciclin domain-containing protein [Afifella marina]MBK1624987.1 hypothetical protein [Afifella marina DSM 2698]MBK1628691.1 hypothetical protein [Afifella marina]MBK5916681.1 hypothetical protein [Afifella marina]RAI17605.1 hypothetical protein CH311_17780 [Afifella marina DSM 2698]